MKYTGIAKDLALTALYSAMTYVIFIEVAFFFKAIWI